MISNAASSQLPGPITLYSAPESIAMSVHFALVKSGLPHYVELIDHLAERDMVDSPYRKINASGRIPAVRFGDGSILTETVAILKYIHDQNSTADRESVSQYRLLEWLSFLTTEIHQRFMRLQAATISDEMRAETIEQIVARFTHVEHALDDQPFLLGSQATVVDSLLYVTIRWLRFIAVPLDRWPRISAFSARMANDPEIRVVLAAQGLE